MNDAKINGSEVVEDEARMDELVDILAEFVVEDQIQKGIRLGMGDSSAKSWERLRSNFNFFGYPTKEEAVDRIKSVLKIK